MLGLALACGGLAASEVEQKARSADERVGPLVPVAVARADLREGTRLTPAAAARAFAVRQAPARFVPPTRSRRRVRRSAAPWRCRSGPGAT